MEDVRAMSVTARRSGRTRTAVTAALLAALLAASAQISIPIGAVPITLQVFIVLLAGLLLPPRGAFAAVAVYILLGAVGLPVFAGGLGGVGVLVGPTGGYLWGFALGATVVALARGPLVAAVGRSVGEAIALFIGVVVIYVVGWTQLAAVTGMGAVPAFVAGVVPFALLDLAKAVVALGVAGALRRAGVAT